MTHMWYPSCNDWRPRQQFNLAAKTAAQYYCGRMSRFSYRYIIAPDAPTVVIEKHVLFYENLSRNVLLSLTFRIISFLSGPNTPSRFVYNKSTKRGRRNKQRGPLKRSRRFHRNTEWGQRVLQFFRHNYAIVRITSCVCTRGLGIHNAVV